MSSASARDARELAARTFRTLRLPRDHWAAGAASGRAARRQRPPQRRGGVQGGSAGAAPSGAVDGRDQVPCTKGALGAARCRGPADRHRQPRVGAGGLRAARRQARIAREPAMVEDAERLVLPGVGAFGATMAGSARRAGPGDRASVGAGAPCSRCASAAGAVRGKRREPGSTGLRRLPAASGAFPDWCACRTRLEPDRGGAGLPLSSRAGLLREQLCVLVAPGCRLATAPWTARASSRRWSAGRWSPASSIPSCPESGRAVGHRALMRRAGW